MRVRNGVVAASILVAGAWWLSSCGGTTDPPPPPPPKPVCADSVAVSVVFDTVWVDSADVDSVAIERVPVFNWSPDCRLGRLIVEQGLDEYWGTETCGENVYESPIRYGVNPPSTCPEEPSIPLVLGLTYQVSVYRFVSVNPESLALLGKAQFTY